MTTPNDAQLTSLIAATLGISEQQVRDDLAFGDIPQWDSLNHVNLMMALEGELDVPIGEDLMVELSTVQAIREFIASQRSA